MNRLARSRRALVVGIVAAAATLSMTQVANAKPAEPEVPPAIAVPAGNKVSLVGHATGVQIYKCDGKAWAFVAPRADLFDDKGKLLTTHFAGPTWQSKDGSTVVGRRVAGVDAPGATAIPWLLLEATSTTPGRLGNTTYIQRIATTGGLQPAASECNAGTVDKVAEVPYTADYYFWKRTGKPGA